jgi:hypothetical protein
LEFLSKPISIIFNWNAHFGAIYRAGENCGRMVYAVEGNSYFSNEPYKLCKRMLASSGGAEDLKSASQAKPKPTKKVGRVDLNVSTDDDSDEDSKDDVEKTPIQNHNTQKERPDEIGSCK